MPLQLSHHPQADVQEVVLGEPTRIKCTVFESVNPATGDYVMTTSIEEMITESGQTVMPSMLSVDELKSLLRKLSQRVAL